MNPLLKEIRRSPNGAVFLTDGHINVAVLNLKDNKSADVGAHGPAIGQRYAQRPAVIHDMAVREHEAVGCEHDAGAAGPLAFDFGDSGCDELDRYGVVRECAQCQGRLESRDPCTGDYDSKRHHPS